MAISPTAHQKRLLPIESLSLTHQEEEERPTKKRCVQTRAKKKVTFSHDPAKVHLFDPDNGHGNKLNVLENDVIVIDDDDEEASNDQIDQHVPLTKELSILSTVHGRQRRELRDISKEDLQTVMKYGTKSKANYVNGEQRWKFEFGNIVYITDNKCTKEITCYKKPIDIQPANITEEMWSNHQKAARILKNDPHLVSELLVLMMMPFLCLHYI